MIRSVCILAVDQNSNSTPFDYAARCTIAGFIATCPLCVGLCTDGVDAVITVQCDNVVCCTFMMSLVLVIPAVVIGKLPCQRSSECYRYCFLWRPTTYVVRATNNAYDLLAADGIMSWIFRQSRIYSTHARIIGKHHEGRRTKFILSWNTAITT